MSTTAKRPSDEFKNKVDENESLDRHKEVGAEDFKEAGEMLEDHADRIDANKTKLDKAPEDTTQAIATAKTEAVNAAAIDAAAKADTAKSEAINTAALDAATKASTAKSEAIDAAALDAIEKVYTAITPLSAFQKLLLSVISIGDSDAFRLADSQGNVSMKYDENGFDVAKFSTHFVELLTATLPPVDLSNLELIQKKTDLLTILNNDVFRIFDADGNIGLKFGSEGLDVNKISEHFIELLTARLPPADLSSLEFIQKKTDLLAILDNSVFRIFDADGNIGLKFGSDGFDVNKVSEHFTNLLVSVLPFVTDEAFEASKAVLSQIFIGDGKGFRILGHNGDIGMKYDSEGFDVAKLSTHFTNLLPTQGIPETSPNFNGEVNFELIFGQSLAMGGSDVKPEPYYSNSLMFEGGVKIDADTVSDANGLNDETVQASRFGSLIPMSEYGGGLNGRITAKKWNELLEKEDGISVDSFGHKIIGFVAGVSGGQSFQMSKYSFNRATQYVADTVFGEYPQVLNLGGNDEGRSYHTFLQGVYFAKKQADLEGKSFSVNTANWYQGEASTDHGATAVEYEDRMTQIFTDLNDDVKRLTGQANDIQFFVYQNASWAIYTEPTSVSYDASKDSTGVPTACMNITFNNVNIHHGAPLYPFVQHHTNTVGDDFLHLDNAGYAVAQSIMTVKKKRVINDGKTVSPTWPRMADKSIRELNGKFLLSFPVDMDVKPLVLDVSGVKTATEDNKRGWGLQPNYGFEILNVSSVDIIESVRTSLQDTIIITCTEDPTGLDLTYAKTGVFGGGNVRDSQGDYVTTEFGGVTYRCDNWMPYFKITI